MKKFTDACIQEQNGNKTFCYRSSFSVFEETLENGLLVNAGCNTAGYPLNVLSNFPSRNHASDFSEPFVFNVELDGETICRKLSYVDFFREEKEGILHTVLTLDSGVSPVRLYEHMLLDGTAMMSRWLEIENRSASPVSLNRLVLHGGVIEKYDLGDVDWCRRPDEKAVYSLGYFDCDEWGGEDAFDWHALKNETQVIDCRFGASRFRHPLLFIKNDMSGDTYFVQLGWSAGCRFTVKNDAKENRNGIKLSYTAEITGYKPLTVIRPGEKFVTPEVYFGAVHGGLDEAVNEMHSHTRKSVLCRPEADGGALKIGAGMGAEHDMSVETSKAFIKQMAQMGAEVFIVDAGWVCPPGKETEWHPYNGLNVPDKDRYPGNAFAELREFCRENGMKFGLWCEMERLGSKSGVIDAHPDWLITDIAGNKTGVIDLTVPEAAEWVENELGRIITEYKLDLLRVDYNVSGNEAFGFRDVGTGKEECLSLRHYEKVYEIYGRLKKKFPDVIFENCAGGGGRTDLGMMRAFNHTWVTDNQKMPRSVMITNGMTMALPPERVDRLFAGMGCHTIGDLKAHMRNTMLTHMSLNVIAPASALPNAEAMEFIRHSTEIYRGFIRPFLPEAKVFHHTPTMRDVEKQGACVLEVASPDGGKAAIAAFSLNVPSKYNGYEFEDKRSVTVVPLGVRADKSYTVTLDNTGERYEESGVRLLRHGINVMLPSTLSSELILIEERKEPDENR